VEKQRGKGKGSTESIAEEERRESVAGSTKRPTAEPDQSQPAGPQVREKACVVEEEMEYDTDSDCVSVTEFQAYSGDLYKLADINVVQMQKKFMKSVLTIQKKVGVETLKEKNNT